jgi:anthranilate synthase component 1
VIGTALAAGTIVPLVREIARSVDPLALYAALTDRGARPGTFLLESAGDAGGSGERSLLGVSAALRIVARGRVVTVDASSANGRSLLPWAAGKIREAGASVSEGASTLRAESPPHPAGPLDEAERRRLPSPLDALRAIVMGPRLEAAPAEACHIAAGVLAYDLIELFETLPSGPPESDPSPHFEMVVPDRLVIVDHARNKTLLVANAYGGPESAENYNDAMRAIADLAGAVESVPPLAAGSPSPRTGATVDLSDADFADLVRGLKRHIEAGDVFQIVASRTYSRPCRDPLGAYARLRAANPSPYLFYVRGETTTVFGASPETALKVHGRPRRVTIRPIAGTAARGEDPDVDARREAALRLDTKETAEHMMLVDLARNDVARVSRPGTRKVTKLLSVDRYAHVMHLVSEVEGELDPSLDALHAYVAAMNMGTLVGAPKIRASQILREVEPSRRGVYGGAVGYLASDGRMDTAIVIRAAVVRDGIARVRAGAGIVIDSDPASEAEETRRKAEAVLRAIAGEDADA